MDEEDLKRRWKDGFSGYLGIEILSAEPDLVVAELKITDKLMRGGGIAHGGVLMSLADSLGGMATLRNLDEGFMTTTIESKTNFLAPATEGMVVRAECRPLHRGRRTMVWQTTLTSPQGRTLAVVTQTQFVMAPEAPVQDPVQQLTALFAGKNVTAQKELLAQLERGGAAVYRALAAQETNATAKAALLAAADREVDNAVVLEEQLGSK